MAKTKKKILLFAENFEKRILAENIVGATNLESMLNNGRNKNRIILEGVWSYYKNNQGIYKPKDHPRGYQIINVNHIDFIYSIEDLIYSENNFTLSEEVSILWGMKGLRHALIGDIKIPGNRIPKFKKNLTKEQAHEKELELITYLDRQLQKNFISLYNPRQDSEDAKKEFADLFNGTNLNSSKISRILINNKKQSNSNTTHAVYLGKSSKNYE